uniref:Predicted protein n=1 Tax=Hordeum vulgare subsp. vulgare TaxID=112509 RepID=F2DGJ2_HORVV|nr:predicted protein [Hordeum vulgare subsp. vulgare]
MSPSPGSCESTLCVSIWTLWRAFFL